MAKLEWMAPEKCPVVNGYVIRIMTTVPDNPPPSSREKSGSNDGSSPRCEAKEEGSSQQK